MVTVDQVAAALVGVRIGGVPLTEYERLFLARIIAANVGTCDCERGTIKERIDAIKVKHR